MSDSTQDYLHDVLSELLERARDASREAAAARANDFAQGRAMAYFEVVDHMVNQLESFGIDRAVVGIDRNFSAMKELR
jgi:hypothetical protein